LLIYVYIVTHIIGLDKYNSGLDKYNMSVVVYNEHKIAIIILARAGKIPSARPYANYCD